MPRAEPGRLLCVFRVHWWPEASVLGTQLSTCGLGPRTPRGSATRTRALCLMAPTSPVTLRLGTALLPANPQTLLRAPRAPRTTSRLLYPRPGAVPSDPSPSPLTQRPLPGGPPPLSLPGVPRGW